MVFIAKGKVDSMTKAKIVDYIVKNASTSKDLIDDVAVHENFSFMTVPFAEAEHILRISKKMSKGQKSLVVKAIKER